MQNAPQAPSRSIQTVMRSILTDEGTEFEVQRCMPQERLPNLSPFALLDIFGPDLTPGDKEGYGAHPHAGIEVLTYCIDGRFENGTPSGEHETTMDSGDIVWMSFGPGAVHYERPPVDIIEKGGRAHVAQLWLGLSPSHRKQPIKAEKLVSSDVPVVTLDNGASARVLVGSMFGQTSPLNPHNDVAYAHITLPSGASVSPEIPRDYNCFVYILSGAAVVSGGPRLAKRQMALLAPDSDVVTLDAAAEGGEKTELLLVSGKPLEQPLIKAATFVMNSPEEIGECFRKYGHMLGLSFGLEDGGPSGPPAGGPPPSLKRRPSPQGSRTT